MAAAEGRRCRPAGSTRRTSAARRRPARATGDRSRSCRLAGLVFAALPALLYPRNIRALPAAAGVPPGGAARRPAVSVLIPARNEEAAIGAAVEAALASRAASSSKSSCSTTIPTTRTRRDRARRSRRRTRASGSQSAPPLPAGWCGKQHACSVARRGWRVTTCSSFLDADVRLAPDGLARLVAFLERSGADLVSGFPRQETGDAPRTAAHPADPLRAARLPAAVAGCGAAGGPVSRPAAASCSSRREPPTYKPAATRRSAGRCTTASRCPAPTAGRGSGPTLSTRPTSPPAGCTGVPAQVWLGLAKNAREGLAAPRLLVGTTLMLLCGQVLPFVLLGFLNQLENLALGLALAAAAAAYYPRFDAAWRFRQSRLGAGATSRWGSLADRHPVVRRRASVDRTADRVEGPRAGRVTRPRPCVPPARRYYFPGRSIPRDAGARPE